MSHTDFLKKESTGLLVVDVQEKLFPFVDRSQEIAGKMIQAIRGFQIFDLPVIATEQYPEGLGPTILTIKDPLGDKQFFYPKTSFSCYRDAQIKAAIEATERKQWVLVGIETHVCILQTAKDLIAAGHEVVVLNDAVSSRSLYDFSTALAELRDCGARLSSTESILFELLADAKAPEFKAISDLIKGKLSPCSCA